MEDILHIYSNHDGSSSSSKAANQLRSLRLASMIRKPGRHLTEVLVGAKL
jgi:hypothetical protein